MKTVSLNTRRNFLKYSLGAAALAGTSAVATHFGIFKPTVNKVGTLAAEFESAEAMLFGWFRSFRGPASGAMLQAINEVTETMKVYVVTKEDENVDFLSTALAVPISEGSVEIIQYDLQLPWVRDFAPLVVKSNDPDCVAIDYNYTVNENDNALARILANKFSLPVSAAPLNLHGGNLITNGAGLCLTTNQLLKWNEDRGLDQAALRKIARKHLGCEKLIFLERLAGEQTGHVDMFATFVSTKTVVVGQYDRKVDAVNAEILDDCANQLEKVVTRNGKLNVVRIPMPERTREWWYTYTNVVYANGKLLVPTYSDANPTQQQNALAIYQQLLPGWKIVPIDCTDLIVGNGVLHCATANILKC